MQHKLYKGLYLPVQTLTTECDCDQTFNLIKDVHQGHNFLVLVSLPFSRLQQFCMSLQGQKLGLFPWRNFFQISTEVSFSI